MNSNNQNQRRHIAGRSQQEDEVANIQPATPFLRMNFGSEAHPASTPLRREHVRQPPTLLTTSFGAHPLSAGENSASAGYLPTPLSTSSLSSPFTQNLPGLYAASPSAAARGSSPMSNRLPSAYNAPYNPQEWASVGRSSPQLGSSGQASHHGQRPQQHVPRRLRHSTDDPVGSPPPPYSPRREERAESSQTAQSSSTSGGRTPSTAVTSGQHETPPSTAISRSVEPPSGNSRLSPRPLSIVTNGSPHTPWTSSFLPPPPPKVGHSRGSRPSSGTVPDRSSQIFGPSSMTASDRQSTHPSSVRTDVIDVDVRPPAARRAVSATGIVTPPSANTAGHSRDSSSTRQSGWAPGMPLPPPPPGPPPGASRSQSASGVSDSSSHSSTDRASWSRTRHQSYVGTSLGPVPPTPAGWVDEDYAQIAAAVREERPPPLLVDTTNLAARSARTVLTEGVMTTSPPNTTSPPTNRNSMHGLFRSSAVRDPSAKGIRERRSESRSGKQREIDDLSAVSNTSSTNPWQEALDAVKAIKPANLDLSIVQNTLEQKTATARNVQRSSGRRRTPGDSAGNSGKLPSGGHQSGSTSSGFTIGRLGLSFDHLNDTPPFSPAGDTCSPGASRSRSPGLPPKALPTPPPQQYSRPPSSSSLYAPSSTSDRPISHLFHLPNDNAAIPAPLTPHRAATATTEQAIGSANDHQTFYKDALKRYQNLLEKEQHADNDADRLRFFADFILAESSLRRRLYSEAWDQCGLELDKIREQLFAKQRSASRRGSGLRLSTGSSSEEPSLRPELQRTSSYQPMLSPIAASMSNGHDEMSSRGRTSSRWWESQTGSSEGKGRQVEKRSKRETKYMGVPRELREAMQYDDASAYQEGQVRESQEIAYGPNEYPPEKVELNEQSIAYSSSNFDLPRTDTPQVDGTRTIQPSTPASKKLDVSRFVTLPPPYPRHYPAIQNHHPDLVAYRIHVRTVSDHEELLTRKREFIENSTAVREATNERVDMNRQEFRTSLSQELSQGNISFAEAAEAESAFRTDEQDEEKKALQSEFDSFQELVLNPLQDLLNERITSTSGMINQLQTALSTESQTQNPNQIAEEGDEQAELLEKLTVLKWLFEARENLHREIFILEMDRSKRYRNLVTLPYKQSNNATKLASTDLFFTQDEQNQRIQFEIDTVSRHEALLKTIESHVGRGVEVQLSAFWDIAPGLVSLLQRIPTSDLAEHPETVTSENRRPIWYGVQIPGNEIRENPSYGEHPMQYLYTLLEHTEKSTYQFIESQINLLCLLHEVRCSTLLTRSKLEEARRIAQIPSTSPSSTGSKSSTKAQASQQAVVEQQHQRIREKVQEEKMKEEEKLTADLKERVTTVEGLWTEALGSHVQGVKEGVRTWLVSTGGWDGMEDDD